MESARTIDRLRLQGLLTNEDAAARLRIVGEWLEAIDLVLLRTPVLSRASEPMPMALGTLDALHLATALTWRDRMGALPVSAYAIIADVDPPKDRDAIGALRQLWRKLQIPQTPRRPTTVERLRHVRNDPD